MRRDFSASMICFPWNRPFSMKISPVCRPPITTPELLEIGDLPLVSPNEKPTRVEALKYYRKAAEHYELELRLFELVQRLNLPGFDPIFDVGLHPILDGLPEMRVAVYQRHFGAVSIQVQRRLGRGVFPADDHHIFFPKRMRLRVVM